MEARDEEEEDEEEEDEMEFDEDDNDNDDWRNMEGSKKSQVLFMLLEICCFIVRSLVFYLRFLWCYVF